jgi:hypothetical protein|tara:strand:+ start:341 stop:613 length:273 start_codon:yes stop_codon:yes gene_type:complete
MINNWEVALIQSNFSENNESYKPVINKNNINVNRGVELFLNGGKRKQNQFHIIFDKMVCFLNREVTIHFEFSFNLKKKKVVPRRKNNVSS